MELITAKNNNDGNVLLKRQTSSLNTLEQVNDILAHYPTYSSFCDKFSPLNQAKGALHPTQCVSCQSPTLTYINLAYGDGRAIAWLILHLTFVQDSISMPNKMSRFELETCAQNIYDCYHHLKTTELMLFFARLIGGRYPVEWHGYITPTKIMSALRDYFMPWRNDLLWKIEKQEQEKKQQESDSKPTVTWQEYCRMKGINKENPIDKIK